MNSQSVAAIIINDLDSLAHRIESLEAHPSYTEALNAVKEATLAMSNGRAELHQSDMRKHFAKLDNSNE